MIFSETLYKTIGKNTTVGNTENSKTKNVLLSVIHLLFLFKCLSICNDSVSQLLVGHAVWVCCIALYSCSQFAAYEQCDA